MNIIKGDMFVNMLISASNKLENSKEAINKLNVFPVPDGDTGTNMSLTFAKAVSDVSNLSSTDVGEASKVLASSSLRGARGNSGVILSQFLRGISKVLQDKDEMDAKIFAAALEGGKTAAYHSADGMIISTPTGSTAYSMAAGGPILQPNSKMVAITPINSHSLTLSRAIVVSPETEVMLVSNENEKVLLSLDGKDSVTVEYGDRIIVTESKKTTKLMKLRERSFCDVLYNKLSI